MALLLQGPDYLQLVVMGYSGEDTWEGVHHGQAIHREFIQFLATNSLDTEKKKVNPGTHLCIAFTVAECVMPN